MPELSEQQRQAIAAEIFAGQKISAIKLHRQATGSELADAKQAVEAMEKELRTTAPEKFTSDGKKSGCLGVVAIIALLASGTAVTVYYLR